MLLSEIVVRVWILQTNSLVSRKSKRPKRSVREFGLTVQMLDKLILYTRRLVLKKNCFSAWASTLNMGLINKVDMVCLSSVGYGV